MSRLLRKTKKKILLKKHKNKRFWKCQVDLKSRHQKWLRTHKNRKGRSLRKRIRRANCGRKPTNENVQPGKKSALIGKKSFH